MAQLTPLLDPDDYQTCTENNDSENCSYISMDDECSSISNPDERVGKESYLKNLHGKDENQQLNDISTPRNHEESPRPITSTLQDIYMQSAVGGEDVVDSEETETNNDPEPSDCFLFLFVLISFGYMLPWTALGSLISYYKARYGASFYVKLYCAYYLPGLPFALLQYKYDTYVDSIFTSKYTYLFRGVLSYIIVIGVLVMMIFSPSEKMLILLFSLLGVCAWLCHGTSSILASMYPRSAIANLQTGVRCPEIIVIIAVSVLNLGQNASQRHLTIFYILICALVTVGAVAWITVTTNRTSKRYFSVKDNPDEAKNLHNYQSLLTDETSMYNNEKKKRISKQNNLERSLLPAENSFSVTYENMESNKGNQTLIQKCDRDRNDNTASAPSVNNEFQVEKGAQSQIELERARLQPLIIALFATMFFSILQASFFAYVTSPVKGRDIEQILYFVRLFSDLLGRPLTRLCRSSYLKTKDQILFASFGRIIFVVLFFVYILFPSLPRSDAFIISIVAVFSLSSGYLTVLIYEYASADQDKRTQAAATSLLNLSFQSASFFAVVLSLGATSTPWFKHKF